MRGQKIAILSCLYWCAAAWESKEAFLKYIKKEDTKGRQICKYIQVLHCFCGTCADGWCVRVTTSTMVCVPWQNVLCLLPATAQPRMCSMWILLLAIRYNRDPGW